MNIMIVMFCLLIGHLYNLTIKADQNFCENLMIQPVNHQEFITFIDDQSLKIIHPKHFRVLWSDYEHIDDMFTISEITQQAMDNPQLYLGDALKIISSPQYDDNQKRYAAFLIKNYL